MIAKKDLINGKYYMSDELQRGMFVGIWDQPKDRFICIKPPKFGQYSIYEMPHREDENGSVSFKPIEVIR